MIMKRNTICVQGGYTPGNGEPRQIPIVQSTTFKYDTSEDMAKLFDLEAEGYFYSRLQNPTNDLVAAKIAQLEGGTSAMLTGSGQAATFFALFNICSAGDHIVSARNIYGGSFNLLAVTMKRIGIDVTFVDADVPYEELMKAFKPNTKAVFGETIANPALTVLDIEKFAKAAHDNGVVLIVDNTFATPINCRPFEWGADIVTHSTTKYMDGHGASLGGAIVDSGKFSWDNKKYPGFAEYQKYGEFAYVAKLRNGIWRNMGGCLAPMNAFLNFIGMDTLGLRMDKICSNALELAKAVDGLNGVTANYPALENNPYKPLVESQLNGMGGGILTLRVGSKERAYQLMSHLKYALNATNIGDARTLVIHPASTIYIHNTEEQMRDAGVYADTIRVSVGIEDGSDLIEDFTSAIKDLD